MLNTENWTPEQKIILEFLRSTSDLIASFKNDTAIIFDDAFPWDLVRKVENSGQNARNLLPEHNLWDLTNNPATAESLKRALGK